MIAEHLSTPSPDTSDYNSENDDVEGSSGIVAIVVDITTMNEGVSAWICIVHNR